MFTFSEEHQQQPQPHRQPASMEGNEQEMYGITTTTAQHQH